MANKVTEVADLIKQSNEEIERLLTDLEEEYLGHQSGMMGFVTVPDDLDNDFIPDKVKVLYFD